MPLRSTKTERGGVKAKPANPGPLGRPKSPLPAQACGPPHPPEAPGLPAAPQHGTASRPLPWQRPAHPLSRSRLWALGSGLKRPWPRALRMSEGPQGSLCCHRWGNPFQGRVPAAWPHPLNHFYTQAPSLLTHTAPEVGGGCGGGPTPPAQLQLAPPGSFPPSLGPRRAPAFVSLCTALPAHLRQEGSSGGCQPSCWLGSLVASNTLRPTPQPWRGTQIDLTVIRHLLRARPIPSGLTSPQPQDPGRGSGHPRELTLPSPAPALPPAVLGCCADGE